MPASIRVPVVLATAIAALTVSAYATAQTVTIPHTFSGGTPARASEVNENFNVVKGAVDAQAGALAAVEEQVQAAAAPRGVVALAVDGVVVGTAAHDLNFRMPGIGGTAYDFFNPDHLLGLSAEGYFFALNIASNAAAPRPNLSEGELVMVNTYFSQLHCAGVRYVYAPPSVPRFLLRTGLVVRATDPLDQVRAYSVRGEPTSTILASVQEPTDTGTTCFNFGSSSQPALEMVPNDPDLTGVPSDLSGPITIVRR